MTFASNFLWSCEIPLWIRIHSSTSVRRISYSIFDLLMLLSIRVFYCFGHGPMQTTNTMNDNAILSLHLSFSLSLSTPFHLSMQKYEFVFKWFKWDRVECGNFPVSNRLTSQISNLDDCDCTKSTEATDNVFGIATQWPTVANVNIRTKSKLMERRRGEPKKKYARAALRNDVEKTDWIAWVQKLNGV